MARNTNPLRPPRNTAPMWKKLMVVLSAPIAVLVVVSLLDANNWNFILYAAVVVGVAAVAVWGMAKLLGVHLSLGSWD
jgi:presenilin-like A22 family membrane protease